MTCSVHEKSAVPGTRRITYGKCAHVDQVANLSMPQNVAIVVNIHLLFVGDPSPGTEGPSSMSRRCVPLAVLGALLLVLGLTQPAMAALPSKQGLAQ